MIDKLLELSGFVLAGGESRRMGRPKALLTINGHSLVERQVGLLCEVAGQVAVVGPREAFSGLNVCVLADRIPGCGPLGGIYSGLVSSSTDYNLFIGCDMPFLTARFLQWIARRAMSEGAWVTVPESREGKLNPLAAVYRREAAGEIEKMLKKKEFTIREFFRYVRCHVVHWPVVAQAGFSPEIFDNLNTPADYEAAQRRLSVGVSQPRASANSET